MNVLLINPPTTNIIRGSLPTVVEDSTGIYPPLGLLYVAAYAESVDGCNVRLIDCHAEKISYKKFSEVIDSFKPDVVGIQAMTFTLIDASKIAQIVKENCPESYIVFGGPHPTIYPHETINLPYIDAVVCGEGEFPFKLLLEAIKKKQPLENICGVITKKNINLLFETKLEFIQNLDDLKMPALHLLNMSLYTSSLAEKYRIVTMMSSRGCPGKCIFCDRPQMGKTFRKRSAENVVREMTICIEKYGISEIKFYDDTFTIDRRRVVEICDLIIESNIKVAWEIRSRVDTMTPMMIKKLRKAGCVRIHYGIETGSRRLQTLLKKNLDLEKVKEVFRETRLEGIETLGYFMIGLPTETKSEIYQTIDLIKTIPMDYAHISIFTPYPGTAIYKQAVINGFYKKDYWKEFAMNPTTDFQPCHWNENFSDEELLKFMKKAYKAFYRRPSYLINRLRNVKTLEELVRKTILGMKLLKEILF